MTDDFGLNSEIRVGKRKLHLQTSYAAESRKVSVSVFDEGRLVDKRETILDEHARQEQVRDDVQHFHDLVHSDLELLFFVANKVRVSNQPAALKKMANLFLEKGFYEEAVEHFGLTLKSDAGQHDCYFSLSRACFQMGKYQSALENLLVALEHTPDYPDIHLLLGKTYWQMNRPILAIAAFKKAIQLNDSYHQAHFTLGLCLIQSAVRDPRQTELEPPIIRVKKGAEHLRRAMALSADYQRKVMQAGFEKLEGNKNLEAAIAEFEKAYTPPAHAAKSAIADGEFYVKFMFAGLGKDNRTLNHYIKTIEKTVAQNPHYADLHRSLGTAYLINGWHYFIKATEEFREAIKINPSFEKAKKSLKLLENDSRGFLILLRAILK